MKKRIASAVMATIMAASLAACGSASAPAPAAAEPAQQETAEEAKEETAAKESAEEESTEEAKPAGEVMEYLTYEERGIGYEDEEWFPKGSKLGMSTMTLGAEFFSALDESMHEYFEQGGYEMVTVSFEGNAATQVSDIENLMNMGCDAIMLFVSDREAVKDVCRKAVEQGIKVYPIATWMDDRSTYTYCQGTDQYQTGVGAAEMAADWIEATFPDAADGSIEVAVIGNSQTEDSQARTDGMYTIEQLTSKAKVVEMFDLSGATDANMKAQEYADIMTGKYPDLKVILAYGVDSELGSNEVYMRDASLDREHFGIFGVDSSMVAYEQIGLSRNNESVIRGTYNLGDDLAMSMYCLATGQNNKYADENGYISEPGTKVTAENVDSFLK